MAYVVADDADGNAYCNYPDIVGNTNELCNCGGVHQWFFVKTKFENKDGSRFDTCSLSFSESGYCGPMCKKGLPTSLAVMVVMMPYSIFKMIHMMLMILVSY